VSISASTPATVSRRSSPRAAYRRILLICDPGLLGTAIFDAITQGLAGFETAVFTGIDPEPKDSNVGRRAGRVPHPSGRGNRRPGRRQRHRRGQGGRHRDDQWRP
jgi:hypothetical protein